MSDSTVSEASTDTPNAPPRAASLAPALAGGALCVVAAAVALGAGIPGPIAFIAGAYLLSGGAVVPVLARLAPTEPSPLKLWTFGALLSPALLTFEVALARAVLGWESPPAQSFAVAAALSGALHLALIGRRLGSAPLGRAAWFAFLASVALGAAVAAVLFTGGDAALLARPGTLWFSAIADGWLRPGVLEHPWLAGATPPASPITGAIVGTTAGLLGVAAPTALGVLAALSATLFALCAYLTAAALWRRAGADLASVAFAVLGGNVVAGLLALVGRGGVPLGGAPRIGADGEHADPLAWSRALAVLSPRNLAPEPAQLDYAGSAFLRLGAAPLALAAFAGALAAGVHAVRHGARPWPLLAAACVAVAALLDLTLGVAAAIALILVGLLAPGRPSVRLALPPLVAAALLPAVANLARFGALADPVTPQPPEARALIVLLPLAALAVPALALVLPRVRRRAIEGARGDEGRGSAVLLLLVAALAAVGAMLVLPDGRRATAALAATATFALGVLAAGAAAALLRCGFAGRLVGAAFGLVLALGTAASTYHAGHWHARLQAADSRVSVDGRRLVLDEASGIAGDVAACYGWIAEQPGLAQRRAVLVRATFLGSPRFAGPTAPHLAVLATGLPLWWDGARGLATTERTVAGDTWKVRGDLLALLFMERYDWDVRIARLFKALDRPFVFVVDEVDRRATTERGVGPRGIDARLLSMGATTRFTEGDAAVLVLEPEDIR